MNPKLIVFLGPTASGKSALALKLARCYAGEIVNADSRQIYEGMRVGTASPFSHPVIARSPQATEAISSRSLRGVYHERSVGARDDGRTISSIPHHLFHIIPPDQYFSVSDYKKLAIKKIRDIARRKKIPFLVGGTGLYTWTVVDNLHIPAVPPNYGLRKSLERAPSEKLYKALRHKDPDAAALTGPNKRRIIRALEVIEATGKKFSEQRKTGKPLFETLQIGLRVPLPELDKKIEARARQMLEHGFLEEIETLLKKYPANLPAFTALGYRHFIQYLQGNLSLDQATEQFVRSHKQLARRQLRWFKRDKRIHWFSPKNKKTIELAIQTFLAAAA